MAGIKKKKKARRAAGHRNLKKRKSGQEIVLPLVSALILSPVPESVPAPILSSTVNSQDLRKVDNPGQGDCAYYAFAVGLIWHLKEEIQNKQPDDNSATPLLDEISLDVEGYKCKKKSSWYWFYPSSNSNTLLDSKKIFENKIVAFDFCKAKTGSEEKKLLNLFNEILRARLLKEYTNQIKSALNETANEDKLEKLMLITLINDGLVGVKPIQFQGQEELTGVARFISMYYRSMKQDYLKFLESYPDSNNRYFALTDTEKTDRDNLTQAFALTLFFKEKNEVLPDRGENESEKQYAMRLLDGLNKLSDTSIINQCLSRKARKGMWGEGSDLVCLAGSLGIPLAIERTDARYEQKVDGSAIYLQHLHGHWVTCLPKSALIENIVFQYETARNKRTWGATNYSTFYGHRFGYTKEEKIAALKKLKRIIESAGGSTEKLSPEERKILLQGKVKFFAKEMLALRDVSTNYLYRSTEKKLQSLSVG